MSERLKEKQVSLFLPHFFYFTHLTVNLYSLFFPEQPVVDIIFIWGALERY